MHVRQSHEMIGHLWQRGSLIIVIQSSTTEKNTLLLLLLSLLFSTTFEVHA